MNTTELTKIAKENKITQAQLEPFKVALKAIQDATKRKDSLLVTQPSETDKMKEAREMRLALKKHRTSITEPHKQLKEDALKYINSVDLIKRTIVNESKALEEYYQNQENYIKIQEENERLQKEQVRRKELEPYNVDTGVWDLGRITEEQYQEILTNTKLAHQARIEQEQKEAEQRRKQEEERALYLKRSQLFSKNGLVVPQKYIGTLGTIDEAEFGAVYHEAMEVKEQQDRQREEHAKLQRQKVEEERQRRAEEERKRKASDPQKIKDYVQTLLNVDKPNVTSSRAKTLVVNIEKLLVKIQKYTDEKIAEL